MDGFSEKMWKNSIVLLCFADNDDRTEGTLMRFWKGLPMKKILSIAGGVAVCLLLSDVSALCQVATPAPAAATEAPMVASAVQVPPVEAHPLMPVIRWAERERPNIAAIRDYTARMQKQENIGGNVQEAQVMDVKVRHEPFSVYIRFLYPQRLTGQQAIFVRGQNDDKLIAHGVGFQKIAGTQRLDPEGFFAMQGNKYPITEMGILNLVDKLLEVAYKDIKFGECEVTYFEDVRFGTGDSARMCTVIQVIHPVRRPHFMFHIARIFVDKELNLPIRYESYDWPRKAGETPQLIEAYTYMNLRLNVGLTDADFDHTNPAYAFP